MNQPTIQPMQVPQNYAVPAHQPQPQQPRRARRWLPWTILVVVIIIVLAAIAFIFRSKLFPSNAPVEKLSGYQAVFLTNGQVYFGKISHVNSDYVQLVNIYYLQVNTPAGSTTGTDTSAAASAVNSTAANAATQLSLVKLGNELHGPADQMFISRDQILFYENLKADGQVAEAIAKYQQSGGTAGATDSTPAQGTNQAPSSTGTSTAPTTGTTGTTGSTTVAPSTSNAPLIPAK